MIDQKWIIRGVAASALAAAMCSDASAGTGPNPQNGNYVFNSTEFCQPTMGGPQEYGTYAAATGTANFAATTVGVSTTLVSGPIENVAPLAMTNSKTTYNWSVTLSTITIGPITYQAVFNDINNNEQPGTIWAVGVDPKGCAHTFIAQIVPTRV